MTGKPEHVFTLDECEEWRTQLGLSWKDLLRDADVKTTVPVVKNRWKKLRGEGRIDRSKIYDALLRAETQRNEPTQAGSRIVGLSEWMEIGRSLAADPEIFARQLNELRPLAAAVKRTDEAKRVMLAAKADLDRMAEAFLYPTPEPKGSRK